MRMTPETPHKYTPKVTSPATAPAAQLLHRPSQTATLDGVRGVSHQLLFKWSSEVFVLYLKLFWKYLIA